MGGNLPPPAFGTLPRFPPERRRKTGEGRGGGKEPSLNFNNICVIGLGYIGLPTASTFAAHGVNVLGVDINESILSTLRNGDIHIHEPGLREEFHIRPNLCGCKVRSDFSNGSAWVPLLGSETLAEEPRRVTVNSSR